MEKEIHECAHCSVQIEPEDELIEEFGEYFCGECCAEVWAENNLDEDEARKYIEGQS